MAHFFVIAASSGIGQATVSLLKKARHAAFLTSRDKTKIKPEAILDTSDFDAVDAVFQQAGEVDVALNCSGFLLLKSAYLTSKKQYQSVIEASLTTAFATVRAVGKHMNKGVSLVLVSSSAATYAPINLRANAVAPGLIDTPLTSMITGNETSRRFSEGMHALGRLGKPEDVAGKIIFLLDPVNDWITGQVLAVGGVLSRIRPKIKA